MELLNRNVGSFPSFNFCLVEHRLKGERLEACVRVLSSFLVTAHVVLFASFAEVRQNVVGCPNKIDEKMSSQKCEIPH